MQDYNDYVESDRLQDEEELAYRILSTDPKHISDFDLEDLFYLRRQLYTQDGALFIRVHNHLEEVTKDMLETLVRTTIEDALRHIGKAGKITTVAEMIRKKPLNFFETINSAHKQIAFKNGVFDVANWHFTVSSGFDSLDEVTVPTYCPYELGFNVDTRLFSVVYGNGPAPDYYPASYMPLSREPVKYNFSPLQSECFRDAVALYNESLKSVAHTDNAYNQVIHDYPPETYNYDMLLNVLFNTPTPTADKFFAEIADGNNDVIERIYQMIGYILVPGNEGKAYFLLQGASNSGKTILGKFLEGYFPRGLVTSLDIKRLGGQFLPEGLSTSCLNLSMDLPNGRLSSGAVAVLKMLTGDDLVTQEVKFKDAKPYRGRCKFIFSTNFDLEMQEYDEAFLNRTICIPFNKSIPKEKQDPQLIDKLNNERSAITAKALACYYFLRSNNFKFAGSDTIRPKVNYRMDPNDVIKAFVQEMCEFTYSDNDRISAKELHSEYLMFCRKRNLPAIEQVAAFSRRFTFLFTPLMKDIRIDSNTNGYAKIKLYTDPIIKLDK